MSSDVLADTLEALRLRGTAYFKADFRAPWGMAVPAKDVAAFHVVVQGQCWLRVQRVGYGSEFAFAKAFKRFFGEGPGAARRSVARTPAATGLSAS